MEKNIFDGEKERSVEGLDDEELIRELEMRIHFIQSAATDKKFRESIPNDGLKRFVRDFGLLKGVFTRRNRQDPKRMLETFERIRQKRMDMHMQLLTQPLSERAGIRPETKLPGEMPLENRIQETVELLRKSKIKFKRPSLFERAKRFARGRPR